jgi:anti-anti-sigma factor
MASDVVERLAVERTPSGTTVHIRHPLTRPVTAAFPAAGPGPVYAVDGGPFMAALTSPDDSDAVLVVSGSVDTATAPQLRDQILSATAGGTRSRAVDLARVTHLDSAGIHVLQQAGRRSALHGEALRLLAPAGSPAHHVLTMAGIVTSSDLPLGR